MNPKDKIPSAEKPDFDKMARDFHAMYSGSMDNLFTVSKKYFEQIFKAWEEYASLKTKAKDEEIERLKAEITELKDLASDILIAIHDLDEVAYNKVCEVVQKHPLHPQESGTSDGAVNIGLGGLLTVGIIASEGLVNGPYPERVEPINQTDRT